MCAIKALFICLLVLFYPVNCLFIAFSLLKSDFLFQVAIQVLFYIREIQPILVCIAIFFTSFLLTLFMVLFKLQNSAEFDSFLLSYSSLGPCHSKISHWTITEPKRGITNKPASQNWGIPDLGMVQKGTKIYLTGLLCGGQGDWIWKH